MKISIREIRRLIEGCLSEAKLGVAEPNPPLHYFDKDMIDEEDLTDEVVPLKGGIIGKHNINNFYPDLDAHIANQKRINNVDGWKNDNDDDLESELDSKPGLFGSWGSSEITEAKSDSHGVISKLQLDYLNSGDESILPVLHDAMQEEFGEDFALMELIKLALERSGVENIRIHHDSVFLFSIPEPPLDEHSTTNFLKICDELQKLGLKTIITQLSNGKSTIYGNSSFAKVIITAFLDPERDSAAVVELKSGSF